MCRYGHVSTSFLSSVKALLLSYVQGNTIDESEELQYSIIDFSHHRKSEEMLQCIAGGQVDLFNLCQYLKYTYMTSVYL
jgi:hypothetical protein